MASILTLAPSSIARSSRLCCSRSGSDRDAVRAGACKRADSTSMLSFAGIGAGVWIEEASASIAFVNARVASRADVGSDPGSLDPADFFFLDFFELSS